MTIGPVIVRELRAEARNTFTFWLRVASGAVVTGVFVWMMQRANVDSSRLGAKLFGGLHTTMLMIIALLVPSLTADCIARERREGTLGLLFLTPLSALGIVLGKSAAHSLRSLSLIVAALPIVAMPVLLGGVTWFDLVSAFALQLCAVIVCLAAGILASAWSSSWIRSTALAMLLVVGLGLVLGPLMSYLLVLQGSAFFQRRVFDAFLYNDAMELAAILSSGLVEGMWSRGFSSLPKGAGNVWLRVLGEMVGVSVVLFLVFARVAAWRVARSWREEPASARVQWVARKLFTPVLWRGFLRRWMRRTLERNPIGWLERRTWSGRLVTWSWFAVMVTIYSTLLSGPGRYYRMFDQVQLSMAWLLVGAIGYSAAGSFRRERETGVMELLLVSPVSERQIIFGRLRGLWGQFLPAALLLVAVWFYLSSLLREGDRLTPALACLTSFLLLPVIGLYFSLRCKRFLSALVLTALIGLLVPFWMGSASSRWIWPILYQPLSRLEAQVMDSILPLVFQLLIAGWLGLQLYLILSRRSFAFERTT